MHTNEFRKEIERIDTEDYLLWLGIDCRITSGSSGTQINIRQCPRCGGSKYKVFFGVDSGLGNCFHGSCVGEPGFNLYTFSNHYLGGHREAIQSLKNYINETVWRPARVKEVARVISFDATMMPDSIALPVNGKNLKYLTDRGFTADTSSYFHWRFSQEGFYSYLDRDNVIHQQNHSRRVVIPIFDMDGELVTFQSRDIDGVSDRKYLFPPNLPGSGRFLYNGHNAVGAKRVAVGEGAFDVAAIRQAMASRESLRDVVPVGTFGKHLSHGGENDQLGAFLRLRDAGTEEVVFLWDGEVSALDDACKSALLLHRHGIKTRIGRLPKDQDPNEAGEKEIIRAFLNAFTVSPAAINRFRLTLRNRL